MCLDLFDQWEESGPYCFHQEYLILLRTLCHFLPLMHIDTCRFFHQYRLSSFHSFDCQLHMCGMRYRDIDNVNIFSCQHLFICQHFRYLKLFCGLCSTFSGSGCYCHDLHIINLTCPFHPTVQNLSGSKKSPAYFSIHNFRPRFYLYYTACFYFLKKKFS